MDSRLLIATRIHHLLIRYLGDGIDIGAMLSRDDYAREVLFVCDASDDEALRLLAKQFRTAPRNEPAQVAGAAPSTARATPAWSGDAAGFDNRAHAAARPAPATTRQRTAARWYKPSTWFGDLNQA